MDDVFGLIINAVVRGIQSGLLPGLLAGAITWSVMKTPETLFRGAFGFILGFLGFALLRGQDLSSLWSQIAATAGGAVPRSVAEYTINIGVQAVVAGLIGATLVLAVSSPLNTIRGALLGALLGTFIGIVLHVLASVTSLPLESIYYAPLVGLIVLVVFAVFGAST